MDEFDKIVDRWNLKQHPFYKAWSAGTLPISSLREYVSEWAGFIAEVPSGWTTLGIHDHALEEVEHVGLWHEFATEIQVKIPKEPQGAGGQLLCDTAQRLFSDRNTAIGALFAFEAQQPETATEKLIGLKDHYGQLATSGRYFAVHSNDYGEAAQLKKLIEPLGDDAKDSAKSACNEMGRALWVALSDIHSTTQA